MIWHVSRQSYYYSRLQIVEIAAGGIDMSGADTLCSAYQTLGEGKDFKDPQEAVEAAIAIARAWRKNEPGKRIVIGHGCTGGMGMELEPCTIPGARKWAEEAYEKLSKCDRCGKILPENYYTDDFGESKFCSDRCWEKEQVELEKLNAEEQEAECPAE
jgi:hypothetical protein